jgi:hypothetical protein
MTPVTLEDLRAVTPDTKVHGFMPKKTTNLQERPKRGQSIIHMRLNWVPPKLYCYNDVLLQITISFL